MTTTPNRRARTTRSLAIAAILAVVATAGTITACARPDGSPKSPAAINIAAAPTSAKKPVTDTFHGVKVTEDYRWLEDAANPDVTKWIQQQNAYTRGVLDSLPNRQAIEARVSGILSAKTIKWGGVSVVNGHTFAMKTEPPKQQPFLVVLDSLDKPESARVLVDPGTIGTAGQTSMDWYAPSPDGSMVAVSLSAGGSESGDVHVFDVKTGKQIDVVIPRVNGGTAGGSLAWAPDGKGFYYTRYPRGEERPKDDMDFYMQVYFHALGTPTAQDRYETGKDLPRIAEIVLDTHSSKTAHNGTVLATVQKGDGGEFIFFLRSPAGQWKQIAQYEDRIVQAVFGPDDALYLISRKNAPRGKVLRMTLDKATLASAKEIIAQGDDTIVSGFGDDAGNIAVGQNTIYLTCQLGGPSEIRAYDHTGKHLPSPVQFGVASMSGLHKHGTDGLLFNQTSYLQPSSWWVYDPASHATTVTGLQTNSPVNFDNYEVTREMAKSKDGTMVPVNIIYKKGLKLDGTSPTLLTAYGGYGVNITPSYRPVTLALLEQGFVWAQANIRGGGEFGESWHLQGNLTKKQNVFDDFAAAADHLVNRGYTSNARLAIEGGSNGGLLVGASLVQNPAKYAAVVAHVGIYDMLRVELSPNGAFNVPEFGTVKDKAQFDALYAYSPYHNVKDGVTYPATLFLTGMNDPRVDAMQSRKMTARLQAAALSIKTSSPAANPILLRTSFDSGHGIGTPLKERIAQAVDAHSFLLWKLGVRYQPAN